MTGSGYPRGAPSSQHLIRDNPDCGTKRVIGTRVKKKFVIIDILYASESHREDTYLDAQLRLPQWMFYYRRVINRRSQLSFHGTARRGGSRLMAPSSVLSKAVERTARRERQLHMPPRTRTSTRSAARTPGASWRKRDSWRCQGFLTKT